MTLFIIILVAAAFILFMVFKTKKEVQNISVQPAEKAIMTQPEPETPKTPQEQTSSQVPPIDNPQP